MGVPHRADDYNHPLQHSDLEAGDPRGGRAGDIASGCTHLVLKAYWRGKPLKGPLMGPLISRDLPRFFFCTNKSFFCTSPALIPLFPFPPSISITQVPLGTQHFKTREVGPIDVEVPSAPLALQAVSASGSPSGLRCQPFGAFLPWPNSLWHLRKAQAPHPMGRCPTWPSCFDGGQGTAGCQMQCPKTCVPSLEWVYSVTTHK